MKRALVAIGVCALAWLIFRNQPDMCCPHCDWEVGDDE